MYQKLPAVLAVLLLCACGTAPSAHESELTFSVASETPIDWQRGETLYIGEPHDTLVLTANLSMDAGTVTIQITSAQDRSLAWSSTHTDGGRFPIELQSLPADCEYYLSVAGTDVQAVELTVLSDIKLARPPDPPVREDPSKPERAAA